MIWLDAVLGFLVPVAWCVWQLVDLKREARRDAAKQGASRDEHPAHGTVR